MEQKNMIIALVLSLIVTGLGNVYNGLAARGIAEFIIALIIGLLGAYVSGIFTFIGLLWVIYVLYDTYLCTNAINNNQEIPLFLTQINLQYFFITLFNIFCCLIL